MSDVSSAPLTAPMRVVGVPKEVYPGECRVAATPDTSRKLQQLGFRVLVEQGAGEKAGFSDAAYREAGCEIASSARELWSRAEVVLKVRPPQINAEGTDEATLLQAGQTLISFLHPAQNPDLVQRLSKSDGNVLAMDAIPRISRAQKMDALSSMANIAGYRAIIEAANVFPRFFTGQITAAGKIPPAKILVIGAGVAGLAAIGAGRALGAIVRAFDTRPVVKEQVQSMGAEFLEVDLGEDGTGEGGYAKEMSPAFIAAEMDLFMRQAKDVDIIVTTALIPGRPAPKLISREMVENMHPGSVIVDLASEQGGNCEVTQPGQVIRHHDVTVIGYTDLPSRMATQASQLYGTNMFHLLSDMGGGKDFHINLEDEAVRGALIVHNGEVTWPPPKPKAPPEAPKKVEKPVIAPSLPSASHAGGHKPKAKSGKSSIVGALIAVVVLLGIGTTAPPSFLEHFTVFVLAVFVGWQVIWNVTPALHTPLMSVTNAISGIIIIGGMLQIGGGGSVATVSLAAVAILIATINIAGGFLVTQRMLKMFRRK